MRRPAFDHYSGTAAPLMVDNIDTDQIIPSREMKTVTRDGLGQGMFAGWRYLSADARVPDPDFVLNQPGYEDTTILVSGENFGCGSSREHAVWALGEFGIRAIIAKSYGDIFYNNCTRNGILPVRLTPAEVDEIAALDGPRTIVFDLPAQTLLVGNRQYAFEIGGYAKRLLLEGLDPIGLTKKSLPSITAFQQADMAARPWIYR